MTKKLSYDVAVIGGGPAGAIAAIASARCGAKTLLVEQNGFLGGMLTMAGTGPMMTFHAGEKQVVFGIPEELVQRLEAQGFSNGHMKDAVGFCGSTTAFDSEGLKLTLEDMALESGVTLLYHTVFLDCKTENGAIQSARLFSKGTFLELESRVFVDASADADLATSAGIPSVYGRESDHLAQPMTMNCRVYGVDRERLAEFVTSHPDDMYAFTPKNLKDYPRYGISGAYSLVLKGKENGDFNVDRDMVLCFETNNPGEYIVNMTRVTHHSAVDPFELTDAEIQGRKQAHETVHFLQKYVPGFENCVLMTTGPHIGIRESRKIDGVYKLTGDDLINNVMFKDAIAMGGYPIDIHSPDGESMYHKFLKKDSWYSIPYRSLITNQISNLIVTGRCLSATHEACAAVRLTPILMAISQGAGTAAAQAAADGAAVNQIDTGKLRGTLKDNGAFLEEYQVPDDEGKG